MSISLPDKIFAFNEKFYSVNDIHGISIRETNSICKDDVGFIWASSKTGVLRLSDDDYLIYQLPYETSNIISVRLTYMRNNLYAYTNNGQIFKYDVILDEFFLLVNMSSVLNNNYLSINRMVVDEFDRLWIASSVGLYMYDAKQFRLVDNQASNVLGLELIHNNQIVYTINSDLYRLHTNSFEIDQLYENNSLESYNVSCLSFDAALNCLMVGTLADGIYFYDFNRSVFFKYNIKNFPRQPVLDILPNTDSTLLIGIDGQGLWEVEKKNRQVLNIYKDNADNPFSLNGNGVYDIFCDENKRVWVSTYSGGLSFFDQASSIVSQVSHVPNNPNSLVNNDVNSVLEDSKGNIWMATNNGIGFFDVKKQQWNAFYHNTQKQAQVFLSLCEDSRGRIWAGTYSSGVYLLDGKTGKEIAHYSTNTTEFEFNNDFVFDIFRDSNNDIWIGGVNGNLICYRDKKDTFEIFAQLPINTINELNDDYLLVGCTYGLVKLDKKTGALQNMFNGYLLYDMHVEDNTVWLCTSGDGLLKYNALTGKIDQFTMDEGLPSDFLNSIIYADGYLWLGTESGVARFNPRNNHIQNFASIFMLSNVSFNLNSSVLLSDGQLLMGSNNGAMVFDPSDLQQMQFEGKIFFQDIIVSGRSIRDTSIMQLDVPVDSIAWLKLHYNQNTIALEMIPLEIKDAGAKFSWKLDGLDNTWSKASGIRTLTYTNIPSGNFVLNIRMYDSSLTHIIDNRSLHIQIIPPFWQTWWFLSLILVLAVFIISFFLLYYIDHLKKIHSDEKIRFFSNTTHDIRTSLTLISAPIEQLFQEKSLSENGKYYLNLISDQAVKLIKVSTKLLDFQKVDIGKENLSLVMIDIIQLINHRKMMYESLAQKNNINLVFNHSESNYLCAVDESMIEKVIDNLISNAIKYSKPNTEVNLNFEAKGSNWIFEVVDQGIGINRKAHRQLFKEFYRAENAINVKIVGSGIGLLLVKNYVNMHGGRITFSSKENVGSSFKVIIPYRKVEVQALLKADIPEKSITDNQILHNCETNTSKDSLSILIVEDNDDLRNFIKMPLSREFNVVLANDGCQAWDIVQNDMPDMVVSDVMMPNMDGFELCRLMKSTYKTSHIPIILLTALSGRAEQLQGLGLGADDYLTKPFDMGLLSQRIKTIIRNREQVREKAMKIVDKNNTEPIFQNKLNDQFVKQALDVVVNNLSNSKFGKEEFASEMNVSSSLLYKKIKSFTDQSPTDFIKCIRLNKSVELLKTKEYSVTEVSEMCGFSSVGYFSTVFKKHFGNSPTETE